MLTSPAKQACQTVAGLELAAEVDPALRDRCYGRWTGVKVEEISRREPEALRAWRQDPWWRPQDGESLQDVIIRTAHWLAQQSQASGDVLAVTHASIIRCSIVHAVSAAAPSFWHLDIGPLTMVSLSYASGRWSLRSIVPLQR